MKTLMAMATAVLAAGLLAGCQNKGDSDRSTDSSAGPATQPVNMDLVADRPKEAIAEIHGAGENHDKIHGKATFTQVADGVKIVVHVEGLKPGKHGIHVHEKADLSKPDLTSAGPHFNPGGAEHHHAGPTDEKRHAGDLGNIEVNEDGKGHLEMTDEALAIEGKNGVIGHSLIIHADPDDLKGQPAGNSGARIAGGAIVASPDHNPKS